MVDTIWFMANVASTGRERSVSRVREFKSGNASFRKRCTETESVKGEQMRSILFNI